MIFNGVATSLGGFIIAFTIGWKFAFAALGTFPFMCVGLFCMTTGIKYGYKKSVAAYAKSGGYAEQSLNNIKVVTAFGQERREITNYVRHLGEAQKQGQVGKLVVAFAFGFFNLLIFTSYAYGLFVGGQFVKGKVFNDNRGRNYTSGDIISTFFGVIIGIFSFGGSAPNIKVVSEGRIAAFNALEVIERKPKILIDDPLSLPVDNIKCDITLNNVSFKYQSRNEKALSNITCTIEQGKTTAFVGPSGSGKSTIVKLVERFYDPDEGEVLVRGQSLTQFNLRDFRRKIGYVGQEPVLFNESIRSNMLNAKPDATDDEIYEALKKANAMKFIERLSKGLDTNAGSSGGQLSGGEKQRIALARAFLKKPDVLILDEATSALDRRNEAEIQSAIEALNNQASITTIVIAHRLSTIKKADKIIVIDKGEIKEVGDHDSLLRDYPNGVYSALVNTQQAVREDAKGDEDLLEESEPSSTSINNPDVSRLNASELPMIKKKSQNTVKTEEGEITKEANAADDKNNDEIMAIRVQRKKDGFFKRLLIHNRPIYFVFIGLFASIIVGTIFPIFAVVWTKILFVMMPEHINNSDLMKYCGFLLLLGVISMTMTIADKSSFGFLSENMSRALREECYSSILAKHVGWFDMQENTTGQLTSILSTEINTLNGASTESIGIMFQA